MKRLFALFAVLLVVSSCASSPTMASPTSGFRQLVTALFHKSVRITDTQIQGVSGAGEAVLEAVASEKDPRLAAILTLALAQKDIDRLGYVLKVFPVGQMVSVDLVCAPEMAVQCEALAAKPNTPLTAYAIPIPLASGLFLARRISS
jgi:hypothetical protein